MAVPPKKQTRSRSHNRRSQWRSSLRPAQLVKCPKCATPKLPHVACHVCGTYKGTEVIKVKHKVTRAERRAAYKAQAAKEKAAQDKHAGHEHAKEKTDKKKDK